MTRNGDMTTRTDRTRTDLPPSGGTPEEWRVVRLGRLARLERGRFSARPRNDPKYYDGEWPFAQTGDIAGARRFLRVCSQTLNDDGLAVSKLFPPGTILITIAANIGRVAVTIFPVACPDSLVGVTPKQDVCPEWLYYALAAKQSALENAAPQNAQKNINLQVLDGVAVPLPPLPEQHKIAEILSTWDRTIEQTEKLIEAKERLKKGLMQQLLTGKLRSPGFIETVWQTRELRAFLSQISRPVAKPSAPYVAAGIRSHGKGTFLRQVHAPEKVMMDTLYALEADELVVNITFAWEGAIAIVPREHAGALVSHRFPTYSFDDGVALREYFRHVILTRKFVHQLGLVSPGGAGRNRVLSKRNFLGLQVSLPDLPEQERIASILNVCESEISLLRRKLEGLQQQKKGLMQELLTGKVRVGP